MPPTPIPSPPSRRRPRRRPTILLLMVLVAAAALALGVVKSRRDAEARARLARWKADLTRAEERARWSEGMHRKGYVSKASAAADRLTLDKVKAEIEDIEAR